MEERALEPANPLEAGTDPLSRRGLLARAGPGLLALAAVGASAPAALGRDVTPSRKPRLTPRGTARDIRRLMAGRLDRRERQIRILRAHRLLGDPTDDYRRGRRTIELLRRQDPPRGINAGKRAVSSASVPQDRVSAAKFWWGYSIYFPHLPLTEKVFPLIESAEFNALQQLLEQGLAAEGLDWVVDVLMGYLRLEVELLVTLDAENQFGGSQLNATWVSPLLYLPSETR